MSSDDLSTSDSSGTDDSSADSPSYQLEQVSVEWRRLLGSTDYERAWGITTGSDGSIYIAGETRGDLDGQTNSGGADAFISKYNPDGTKEVIFYSPTANQEQELTNTIKDKPEDIKPYKLTIKKASPTNPDNLNLDDELTEE
tara:strand:- start:207 stop:632 length:426 start_codon:yes stop_codon:yes gene_type:complete